MTNGNSSDRLDRIEAIVESNSRAIQATSAAIQATSAAIQTTSAAIQATSANLDKLNIEFQETKAIANSNSRAIQAMLEQQATDRLRHQERMEKYDQEIAELKDISSRLTKVQTGMAKMLSNIDETNPTILRRLMAIENKVDQILEREPE